MLVVSRRRLPNRATALVALALLLSAGVTRGPVVRAPMTREAATLLARAAQWGDSLVAATRTVAEPARVDAASAVALRYLERHRLGLGSPFRLIELVLGDP